MGLAVRTQAAAALFSRAGSGGCPSSIFSASGQRTGVGATAERANREARMLPSRLRLKKPATPAAQMSTLLRAETRI